MDRDLFDGFEDGATMTSPGLTLPKSCGPRMTRAVPRAIPADAPVPRKAQDTETELEPA